MRLKTLFSCTVLLFFALFLSVLPIKRTHAANHSSPISQGKGSVKKKNFKLKKGKSPLKVRSAKKVAEGQIHPKWDKFNCLLGCTSKNCQEGRLKSLNCLIRCDLYKNADCIRATNSAIQSLSEKEPSAACEKFRKKFRKFKKSEQTALKKLIKAAMAALDAPQARKEDALKKYEALKKKYENLLMPIAVGKNKKIPKT